MKSDKDVGAGATGTVDRRLAATRRAARVRAAALGELAIEKAKLSRQIAELEQSNSRLEELAGAVTHDLSEGLATISMFVEALASRLGDGLDPAAARDLNGIRAGLERMNLLVSEELNAARVGGRTGSVDSEVALSAALSNLEARISRIGFADRRRAAAMGDLQPRGADEALPEPAGQFARSEGSRSRPVDPRQRASGGLALALRGGRHRRRDPVRLGGAVARVDGSESGSSARPRTRHLPADRSGARGHDPSRSTSRRRDDGVLRPPGGQRAGLRARQAGSARPGLAAGTGA